MDVTAFAIAFIATAILWAIVGAQQEIAQYRYEEFEKEQYLERQKRIRSLNPHNQNNQQDK